MSMKLQTPTRRTGRPPSLARQLVMTELQRHARSMLFSPERSTPGLSPQMLAGSTGLDLKLVRTTLNNMHGADQIINAGTHNSPLWRLPTAADLNARDGHKRRRDPSTDTYDGAELRPNSTRPGAMDAFGCPSLSGNTLTPYRRPRPGM